ncbi:hypothetical protein COEREDRAFT_7030 [Coemansia reversa NRRL 1564]|uniref:SWIRM domain-containing protein n=1 Tax=Coemansia reversa (strain ATCC 12441 / NRRL 1564) TaxID=763665 RepID=A0A2G5BFP3_COERN|nr:hypothetical protein COEREDRAFT_7030 [Coemansia reversa NRRL 1564]|eukprot:PIA17835.1 hypothetical protein COEREDRAFT_7030 [Coemansia reversa NRRL 1564]
MAPTSVIQQAFWDRVPNATSRVALLGRRERSGGRRNNHAELASSSRISKRKQSHPTRSPLAPPSPDNGQSHANTRTEDIQQTQKAEVKVKARRLSLDHHMPRVRPVDSDEQGRAFRLSFSDEYLRNPQRYVQALISCESPLATPTQKPHSGNRSRRSNNQRSDSKAGNSRRHRSRRFHNLQLEQTIASDIPSENEDTNSFTTTTSDINDLITETDSQVPGTPTRSQSHLQRETPSSTPRDTAPPSPTPANSNNNNSRLGSDTDLTVITGVEDAEVAEAIESEAHEDKDVAGSPDMEVCASADGAYVNEGIAKPKGRVQSQELFSRTDRSSNSSSGYLEFSEPRSKSPDLHLSEAIAAAEKFDTPSYQRLGQSFSEVDVSQIVPQGQRSTVKWNKADPIDISEKPMADKLAAAERHCCSVLRILPEQYLTIKHTLLKESQSRLPLGTFKKRDAQRLCRIDVNKTSKIYEWYVSMGWLPTSDGIFRK